VAESSPQFRSAETAGVLKKAMPSKQPFMNEEIAAAELALKAHALAFDAEMLAEMTDGDRMMGEIAASVDLTEAPEDAVCSLVTDLLQYCEREKIDWNQDVMWRARRHLRRVRACEVQKR
jgi:hypothetical protein